MKSKLMSRILIDIGGTGTQYKINNDDIKEFSCLNKDKNYVLEEIAELININSIINIGISSPGACNSETGWIDGISGIKDYGNFNFYDELKEKLKNKNINIIISNDANSALADSLKKYTEYNHAIQITIGTGIGGSISYDKKIISGKNGYSGEFGYMLNFCNNKNISQNISASSLINDFKGKYKDAKHIFEKEKKSKIFLNWINKISRFIINIQYSLDPEVIFLSGGVTKNENFSLLVKECIEKIIRNFESITMVPNVLINNSENSGINGIGNILNDYLQKKEKNERN